MTRTGPSKPADGAAADGRLQRARSYLRAAYDLFALADDDADANPIISNIVLSAIAYADAVTARLIGAINKHDHSALPALLRDALGERLPDPQTKRLKRIIAEKDPVQYGPRAKRKKDAERLLLDLKAFAEWAEGELARRR